MSTLRVLAASDSFWLSNQFHHFVEFAFGGDAPDGQIGLLQIAARGALVYMLGVIIVRIGKGRMIGRATALDVITGFILGSLLSRAITGHASLSETIVASLTLIFVHWMLTYIAVEWHWFGNLFKGHSHRVVVQGQMQVDEMRHSHISEHDLLAAIRLQGARNLAEVEEAWKERSGEISVIRRRQPMVVDVAVQSGVQTVRIEIAQ